MVTPHPVGAPYHIWHMFLTEVLLCPSFFSSARAFVVNVQTSVMHPSVAIYRPQYSCICRFVLCTQSIRNHFPDLQQVIPRQYHIHETYFLHWYFPFVFLFVFIFWLFHALHFQLMYQRMIALIPCQTGSQSHYPLCCNFSHLSSKLV